MRRNQKEARRHHDFYSTNTQRPSFFNPLNNPVPIILNIGTTEISLYVAVEDSAELNPLLEMVQRIKSIHIDPLHLNKDNIKAFAANIQQLLALRCVSNQQEFIKKTTRHFFETMINRMPNHVILPGNEGFGLHLEELRHIDDALTMINRALIKTGIIHPNSLIQISSTLYHHASDFSVQGLPRTLSEFIYSIDLTNPACMRQWDAHFQSCTPELLGIYLTQVCADIQQNKQGDELDALMYMLKDFIEHLNVNTHDVAIRMFSDLLEKGNQSPKRKLHKSSERHVSIQLPTESNQKRDAEDGLKAQLEALFQPQPDSAFNDHFAAFRQALSNTALSPNANINDILEGLQHHLSHLHLPTITPNAMTIQTYINQRVDRISHPLSIELRSTLEDLLAIYSEAHNQPVSLHKSYKLKFLNAWMDNITTRPEKTYAECYRLTQDNLENTHIQSMLNEKKEQNRFKGLFNFKQHHFKDFVKALSSAEPDYDVSHPTSQQVSMRLST